VKYANCLILDEFLAAAEVKELLQFTLERESEFQVSEVISPGAAGSTVDYEHRRSLVLMNLGRYHDLLVDRIRSCWPRILQKLEHEAFVDSGVEAQITASNDGDYFRCHSDNGQDETAGRELTFVYFFHRTPKKFSGGELRIYDSRREGADLVRTGNYRAVIPLQNQLVLFDSSLEHEITPIECPCKEFADSRFTVNGWFHR
jgi:SM-20-related protein